MATPLDMIEGSVFNTRNYGKVKIIKYINWIKVKIVFLSSGSIEEARAGDIRKGKIRDRMQPSVCGVGFIGCGKHNPKNKTGKNTDSYTKWLSMLTRCYSDKLHASSPTYTSCEVCEEWQDYQCFAEWFDDNYPKDGKDYHLDKDIKIEGNKIYSPDNCLFVTSYENASKSGEKSFRFISPSGEEKSFTNLRKFCECNNLTPQCMSKVHSGERKHHKGWRAFSHA